MHGWHIPILLLAADVVDAAAMPDIEIGTTINMNFISFTFTVGFRSLNELYINPIQLCCIFFLLRLNGTTLSCEPANVRVTHRYSVKRINQEKTSNKCNIPRVILFYILKALTLNLNLKLTHEIR